MADKKNNLPVSSEESLKAFIRDIARKELKRPAYTSAVSTNTSGDIPSTTTAGACTGDTNDGKPAQVDVDTKYRDIEKYMKHSTLPKNYPFIFLHPDETRKKYTKKELQALKKRKSEESESVHRTGSERENEPVDPKSAEPSGQAGHMEPAQTALEEGEGSQTEAAENRRNIVERKFEVGLFISEHVSENIRPVESVFLQTYFSDNHKHTSNWNYVRDLLKSVFSTNNYTAARSTLTQLLSAGFRSEESAYCSFAISIASALSNDGERTNFELLQNEEKHSMVKGHNVTLARQRLCALMDIVFSKMKVHRFLLKGNAMNVYRLGHCRYTIAESKTGCFKKSIDAVFCFFLQCGLTVYVGLEMFDIFVESSDGDDGKDGVNQWNYDNLGLAIIASAYSFIVFLNELNHTYTAVEIVYHTPNFFGIADIFVNVVLHFFLLFAGFVVIFNQETYIDAVLNVAALLFIIEIDDTIVDLLGSNTEKAVNNFLIKRSMNQLDTLVDEIETENSKRSMNQLDTLVDEIETENSKKNGMTPLARTISNIKPRSNNFFKEDSSDNKRSKLKLDFSDYYLTNYPEQGSNPVKGDIFQPFAITEEKLKPKSTEKNSKEKKKSSYLISPSRVVTANCLIKKITWWYTSWGDDDGTEPRIGKLKIALLNGSKEVIINSDREKMGDKVVLQTESFTLEGVFIITIFQMSVDVIRLRLCGSKDAKHFKEAFEHYSLWDIDSDASKVLKTYARKQKKGRGAA